MSPGARQGVVAVLAAAAGLAVGVALPPLARGPEVAALPELREGLPAVDTSAESVPTTGARVPGEAAPAEASAGVILPGPVPELYPMLLDRAALDLTGDGAEEQVELYANVERDRRGRLMWDDGQRWMLLVRAADDQRAWVLFDDFVQLGRLSFWAVRTDQPPNALVVEIAAGAGVRVWRVGYDRARGGFIEQESVAASGNVIHRSPAELE